MTVWSQIDVNKPHLVYIILGGFTTLFMLCSSVIKERLYIGEATVATVCGIIFGPHGANLISPNTWGNTDQITLEFSRIVLVVQCFAVGVELPKAYMERHWRSVAFLLIPVMTVGWLLTSLFIWGLFSPSLNWLDSLVVAACVTATDPVLASSVVGKGKFAKRVPKHLRDLLSAESGCNDGMAFPFIYLPLYLIKYRPDANAVSLHWICITILYECIFGCVYGVTVGYIARIAIRYAHKKDWIDRESFLVFYFVLALFCAGSGSILGVDDLLVGFACGVGFSNDGWFTEKTEETHVSNVIDLLINLAFFVYFGAIIPWEQYNAGYLNLDVWRLVVLALLVLFFRRIPIMMALKPIVPDIKTWREALFAGHFGPIGVGAIFVAILARGELETEFESTTPLAVLPGPDFPHYNVIETVWPIVSFLVMTSIIVHGSSIAVFTLGKHINTITLTMSYTQANDGPSWMERLPRIQSRSKTQTSQMSDTDFDEKHAAEVPPGMLPAIGQPGNFLRRQREEDNPSRAHSRTSSRTRSRRSKKWEAGAGPGGPISQSAFGPVPRQESDSDTLAMKSEPGSEERRAAEQKHDSSGSEKDADLQRVSSPGEIFEEGDKTVYEDEEGNVLAVEDSREEDGGKGQGAREDFEQKEGRRLMHQEHADENHGVAPTKDDPDFDAGDAVKDGIKKVFSGGQEKPEKPDKQEKQEKPQRPGEMWRQGVRKMSTMAIFNKPEDEERPKKEPSKAKNGPARAYQYGNTIIVEDEDGEVIKKYDIPGPEKKQRPGLASGKSEGRMANMGRMLHLGGKDMGVDEGSADPSGTTDGEPSTSAGGKTRKPSGQDDEGLRFTITAGGRRMSTADFINEIRQMDPKRRATVVENSTAPEQIKREVRKDAREQAMAERRGDPTAVPVVPKGGHGEGHRESSAALHQVASNESGDLKLIDSNEQEIPFHNVSSELRNFQIRTQSGETAAERRRREALEHRSPIDEEDSEDDGTDRVPPSGAVAGPSAHVRQQASNTAGETAAEKRRREGALGHSKEEESDSEEDDEPRQVAPRQNIRFADTPTPQQRQEARQSTLRWGKNVGR